MHAARFGAPTSAMAPDTSDVDDRSEEHAPKLAAHGADEDRRLASQPL